MLWILSMFYICFLGKQDGSYSDLYLFLLITMSWQKNVLYIQSFWYIILVINAKNKLLIQNSCECQALGIYVNVAASVANDKIMRLIIGKYFFSF